jgi:hypothetical protein
VARLEWLKDFEILMGRTKMFVCTAFLVSSYLLMVAETIPAFDLKQACRGSEAAGMAGRTFQMCIESEETARNQLKKNWPEYIASDKAECMRMIKITSPPSYTELISCLETKRDLRKMRGGRT